MNVRFLAALLLESPVSPGRRGTWRRQHRSRPMHHEDRAGYDDLHRLSTTEVARPVLRRHSDIGPTIIVLDAQQDELRDMALEIRILRNVGQKDDSETWRRTPKFTLLPRNTRPAR